jgi:dephospho-CoA kinase
LRAIFPEMTRTIGLTGGIGSGKSTVARLLEKLGACVIDADAIVHELEGPGQPLTAEIAASFGPRVLRPDGAIDRETLGTLVFRDAAARLRLNQLVHPRVGGEIARRVQAARNAGVPVLVLDIPLLLEVRGQGPSARALLGLEAVVVVWVPLETQIARLMQRDGFPQEEALRRVSAQMPLDEKRKLADQVIDNSGALAETERQVRALWAKFLGEPPATTEEAR